MKTHNFKLNEEMHNMTQACDYEVRARKEMVEFMSKNGMMITEPETFKQYHKEYIEAFANFEIAKLEIENNYLPEEFLHKSFMSWSLNYYNGIVTITYED